MKRKATSPDTNGTSEISPQILEKRLGWFQISLLTLLWSRNMYGLEIQTHLQILGNPVSVGQLYPALKSLEKNHLVTSYEQIRRGVVRKFYALTTQGKQAIMRFVDMFKNVFNQVIYQKLTFIPEHLLQSTPKPQGQIALDISLNYPESYLRKLVQPIGPTGHYFLLSESNSETSQLNLLIEYIAAETPIQILHVKDADENRDSWFIPLPDDSIDVVYSIFRLPHDKAPILIAQIRRLLKKNGVWAIVDMQSLGDHILQDLETTLRTPHGLSTESAEFSTFLLQNRMEITRKEIYRGLIFLDVKRISE